MDFDQLEIFLEVARLSSFSRAAEKRFRTQPAISSQIRALEEEVGARLLDRSGGRVSLTASGKLFFKYAEETLERRKTILNEIAETERVPRGEIVVGANEGTCLHILPEVFAQFKRDYPNVAVNIKRSDYARILDSILENVVDFGVVSLPVNDNRLDAQMIHRDELVVITSPKHPLASKTSVTVSEVATYPLVMPKLGHTRDALDALFYDYHLKPQVAMELDSSELLKRFVAADVGVGFIPRSNVEQDIRAKALVAITLADVQIRRDLALVFRKDKSLSRSAKAFMEIAVKEKNFFHALDWETTKMTKAVTKPVAMKQFFRFIFLLFLTGLAAAQKQSSLAAPRLAALKATGTTRYTDKEILAASGLQIGQLAADGDFKEAVQRLGNSGLFGSVVYSYTSSGTSIKLEVQLTDIDESKLVPAHFDNFVWFTDDELVKELQKRVPLFKLLLPVTGNLPDHVSEGLQSILSDHQYPGRVDYLREGDEAGGSLHGIDYHVEEVGIEIRDVEFPGASPEQAALLETAAHSLKGAEYRRAAVAAVAKFDLLPVYLQRGYLKAAFAPSNGHVISQTAATDSQDRAEITVDAIVPVTPGKIYSTSGVAWKGNLAISSADLATLIHMPVGEPADAVRLLHDIENLSRLYRSRGYMMAQVKPDAQLNDEKSTAHYDLNVIEGDLYKMGELEILGLDTQTTAHMRAAWLLREGQPYNADYPNKFRMDTGKLLPRGVQWAVTVHESLEKDKTVDVEIRFKQQ